MDSNFSFKSNRSSILHWNEVLYHLVDLLYTNGLWIFMFHQLSSLILRLWERKLVFKFKLMSWVELHPWDLFWVFSMIISHWAVELCHGMGTHDTSVRCQHRCHPQTLLVTTAPGQCSLPGLCKIIMIKWRQSGGTAYCPLIPRSQL